MRRWAPRLIILWVLAFGAAIVAALAWQSSARTGLVLAIGIGVAAVTTVVVAVRIRNYRAVRVVRWAGVPGASGLVIVDGQGAPVTTLGDVREATLVRWSIPSRLGRTDGLALRWTAGGSVMLGARVRDGANVTGGEPLADPCDWLAPGPLWVELERAARPGKVSVHPPKKRR